MSSLRLRIAALAALVALFAVSVSALAGVYSVRRSVREQQERVALMGLEDVRIQLRQLSETMAFEVRDYAVWDELYEQMPRPSAEWASLNLRPGQDDGRICQVFVLVGDGTVLGRYRAGDQRRDAPAAGDPAPAVSLIQLAARAPATGIALVAGMPVLWSSRTVARSDGTGTSRRVLIGLAYFDHRVLSRFHLNGWVLGFAPGLDGAAEPKVTISGSTVTTSCVEPALGGGLRITATEQGNGGEQIVYHANNAIAIAGVITALAATLAGVVLGFHWVRPIHRLAEACRRRVREPEHVLPVDGALSEAAILGSALNELVDAERKFREDLAAALDRETTANAVQGRFLAQLGHEFGDPIRHLIASVDRLAANDGRLPPEEVAAAHQIAHLLEERFHEILGLTAGGDPESIGSERDLGDYLSGVGELLRPVAARRGVALQVDAPAERVTLDTRLLTPVLVNLAANAITATVQGSVKLSVRRTEDGGTRWTVADTGGGLPEAVALAITNAEHQGGSVQGVPHLGLGLALVLANLHALEGHLRIVSTGPTGTVLQFELPPGAKSQARLQRLRTPPGPVRYN